MSIYDEVLTDADELLGEFAQGFVRLECSVPGSTEVGRPWVPGAPTVRVYRLKATVAPVDRKLIDGVTVVGTERMVVFSPRGRLLTTNGVSTPGTADEVLLPRMTDSIYIDSEGRSKIKRLLRIPEAGTAVVYKAVIGT